ncbi:MAG: serine/threonine protein kinase, partial [Monoglobaceae bacterium]
MSKLLEYIEISAFNESTSLVQKENRVYVKKRVPRELTYIYKVLVNNHHKNISDIIEIFEYEDISIVIEEYINGDTLSDILDTQGVQSEAYTKNVIGCICDGLIFLHKHNIIHRDINPNNIMITKDGTVKIIDFDISRSVREDATSDTVVLGTVGYAAPEQFGFSQSDARTDIYAVGVLANVMLTGKMPKERLYGGRLGRIIGKATAIDAQIRYKNIASFKHSFTKETDENTNKL